MTKIINIMLWVLGSVILVGLLVLFVYSFYTATSEVKAGIISFMGAVVLALYTHSETNKREINARHFKDKRESYLPFIDMLFEAIKALKSGVALSEKERDKKMLDFKKKLIVWGGADIIRAWNEFEIKASKEIDNNAKVELMEDVLRSIRKDLGHDDDLEYGNLLGLILIPEDREKLLQKGRTEDGRNN